MSQVVLVVKTPPAGAGDMRDVGSIPGLDRSPGAGNGNAFQYSCLENPRQDKPKEEHTRTHSNQTHKKLKTKIKY